ncbi:hypothetical protein [Rubrobacter indicoceani]|uniref:hypothetical protein n=1 Tax=Rubrobacter indicoceani TaxID=2051957 RepID=UPI000E5B8235|nr:hypothetical protein [Rubrobacter indicoceani]
MQPENARHVVVVGAPDGYVETLVIVVGGERAVPLFGSTAEADEFLGSLTGVGKGWFPAEIPPADLRDMLDAQPENIRYVALSPPPEDLEGGMEFRLLEIGSLSALLTMQAANTDPALEEPQRGGFFRRLFGR